MDDNLANGLKQELLYRLHPNIKIKMVGEDEVTEEDLEEWKNLRKERKKAEAEAARLAEEKAARGEKSQDGGSQKADDDDEA